MMHDSAPGRRTQLSAEVFVIGAFAVSARTALLNATSANTLTTKADADSGFETLHTACQGISRRSRATTKRAPTFAKESEPRHPRWMSSRSCEERVVHSFRKISASAILASMRANHRKSAERARAAIEGGWHEPSWFRSALLEVSALERDAWVDVVLGLGELPDDGPELPTGCVPYLPCPVDDLLHIVDRASVRASDVFVDVGSGVGRAAMFVHLLTGASAIGIEVQPQLVRAARELAARLRVSRVSSIEGDAVELTGRMVVGKVFFLYCPFSGERLTTWLARLEPIARTQPLRVCSVDLSLPRCDWLVLEATPRVGLEVHRSIPSKTHINT